MKDAFRRAANKISNWTGTAWAFLVAFGIVLVWAITGPAFDFSGTWQLVINTGTTIVTFLMVFLIQNTQNRDGKALQLKLDELIRSSRPARDNFLDLEDMTDDELEELDAEFKRLHETYENNPPTGVHKLHKKIVAARTHRKK
jgi:low affinity Fe/Cu permease